MEGTGAALSGRRREARRNDALVVDAAREVFAAHPDAPMSAVAERAGVGQGSLYRRYRTKDELLHRVCLEGMHAIQAHARQALADDGDPWESFERFMRGYLDSGAGVQLSLAGTFTPGPDLFAAASETHALIQTLIDRTASAGRLRDDITAADLSLLVAQIGGLRLNAPERDRELHHRYLALVLQALRPSAAAPLPGPPATAAEIEDRWTP
ncbi:MULTISPECIES: TetR/AcrR family transcriptional regulator [Actinomadura]|uniref:TetR/AcrR family transcriptional regulator n=1 Tax=Actinomadura yumaensis TaxID=111807 RepID=A0ABW2CHL7_9ACTN|nr:TetR/AcrR family transcriptional regulator [Actinomadura sp. J1-007]MWK34869.1 TetR family transcriptional regulator [Actinomadura sp. J1-007]